MFLVKGLFFKDSGNFLKNHETAQFLQIIPMMFDK